MAKKKSKKIELSLIIRVVALVLAVGAVCFGFLQCVTYTGKLAGSTINLTGFEIMFGKENYTSFSIMALLAFLLPLAGGVLALFKSKLLDVISLACFVVGAVFLFMLTKFVVLPENSLIDTFFTSSLAVGSILSAIASILGAVSVGYVAFFTK